MFQALVGETIWDLRRRILLERAAHTLRNTEYPITEIAFEAGYATHEAFIRAFRAAFGVTPTDFRKRLSYDGQIPALNGVHFGALKSFELSFVPSQGIEMNVEIREIQPRKALCISHKGPYFMIGATFGEFFQWAGPKGIPVEQGVGFYYDDPNSTPPEDLRSDAGAFVDGEVEIDNPKVHWVQASGGKYAVYTHIGSYEHLGNSWGEFMGKWFPSSGYEFREAVPFELYIDDCQKVPVEKLRTELWVAIK